MCVCCVSRSSIHTAKPARWVKLEICLQCQAPSFGQDRSVVLSSFTSMRANFQNVDAGLWVQVTIGRDWINLLDSCLVFHRATVYRMLLSQNVFDYIPQLYFTKENDFNVPFVCIAFYECLTEFVRTVFLVWEGTEPSKDIKLNSHSA